MTAYERYSGLVATGEHWLGKVPSTWKTTRLKNLFQIRKDIAGRLGFDVLSVTQRGVKLKDLTSGEGQISMDYSKYQIVFKDDFVMNHMDLLTGFVDISPIAGVTSPDYRVFIPRVASDMHPRFYLYIFQLCYLNKIFFPLGQGSAQLGRWRLPRQEFENFILPVPKRDEQARIARFLDYETARIDALIEKQQQLIALLKEKRQAVISHAVTKGLNPNAPLRDSGVEWLGMVPAHWEVSRLKFLVQKVVDCHHSTPNYDPLAEWPALRTTDLQPGRIDVAGARRVHIGEYSDRISRHKPVEGDIVFAREGTWGIAAPVPANTDLCLAQRVMLLQVNRSQANRFLMWGMNSTAFYNQLAVNVVGSASPHVNISDVMECWLAVPPKEEQVQIAQRVDSQLSALDALDRQCDALVAILQERRTALISAAVTGKIDVRGWEPPESNVERNVA